ncbi:unnamed protein product [Acanthoscelides obtectus]|nr:unnamed protein product [Acanthoscelides obtectus]CAK1674537.1 hypothetical protein AOBTE_LOCUS29650 [Acanthoscelides obtectus]
MLVNTSVKREDKFYANIQEHLGIGMAGVATAIDKLIKGPPSPEEIKEDVIPALLGSSSILCLAFRMMSNSRKYHIHSKFSRFVKNAVKDCRSDGEYLFGKNMAEALKNMNEKKTNKKPAKDAPKAEVKEEGNKDVSETHEAESMLEEAAKQEVKEEPAADETPMESSDMDNGVKTEEEHASTTEDTSMATSLGDDIKDSGFGPDVHQAIAARWCKFLQHGVERKDIDDFAKKYLVPKNIPFLKPPKMNPELKDILREQPRSEDRFMVYIQFKMGVGLSAIAEAVDKLLTNEVGPDNFKTTMLPLIADAGKIMCGAYNAVSVNRKYYIENKLEKPFKQAIKESIPDEYICGAAIGLTIKQIQDNLPGARPKERFHRGRSGPPRGHSRDRNRSGGWRGGRGNRRNFW